MDKKIGSLIEAGLSKYYKAKEMDKIARIANSKVVSVRVVPLTLVHLSGPFFLWMLALLMCILVFFYEVISNFFKADSRKSNQEKVESMEPNQGEENTNTRRRISTGTQQRMNIVEL